MNAFKLISESGIILMNQFLPHLPALSAVKMEYIHTPAFANLGGPAADVNQTLT